MGEFVDELHKMKSCDAHTLLIYIKHYVMDIRRKMLYAEGGFSTSAKRTFKDAHKLESNKRSFVSSSSAKTSTSSESPTHALSNGTMHPRVSPAEGQLGER